MSLINEIKSIETSATRHPDWFYHAFFPKPETYSSMLTEGIKCRKLMPNDNKELGSYVGHNGYDYISLSKMKDVKETFSSFIYYQDKPAFIIDDIEPKKCSPFLMHRLLERTTWPFRYSIYLDEYQAFRLIEPDKFVGLRCSISRWYSHSYKFYLKILKEMILYMKENNINLPIYDYTEAIDNNKIHLVNPAAYLELYDDIESDLHEKELKYLNENNFSQTL